jgi:hypothetical protein
LAVQPFEAMNGQHFAIARRTTMARMIARLSLPTYSPGGRWAIACAIRLADGTTTLNYRR